MVLQFPAPFANRLEMLRQIIAVEGEKNTLTKDVQQKEIQISSLMEEVQVEKEQKSAKIDQLKLAHSSEVEQLRLQVRDLNAKSQLVISKAEAEIAELKSNAIIYKSQIANPHSRAQFQEREKFKQIIYSKAERAI